MLQPFLPTLKTRPKKCSTSLGTRGHTISGSGRKTYKFAFYRYKSTNSAGFKYIRPKQHNPLANFKK
jgi:hypothetical protein